MLRVENLPQPVGLVVNGNANMREAHLPRQTGGSRHRRRQCVNYE